METKNLIEMALAAAGKAWAPYSHFRVGAAVLLADGTVVCGNNQENAAYPLGSCAERVAVNYARATYPGLIIKAIAIASPDSKVPVSPCGGCREVLMEAVRAQAGEDIRVVMASFMGQRAEIKCVMATELMPYAFDLK